MKIHIDGKILVYVYTKVCYIASRYFTFTLLYLNGSVSYLISEVQIDAIVREDLLYRYTDKSFEERCSVY